MTKKNRSDNTDLENSLIDYFLPVESSEITEQEILNALITADKNLDLKTRIDNPKKLAIIDMIADMFNSFELLNSEKILRNWTLQFKKYLISLKGLGREEIIRGIIGIKKSISETTIQKKMITNLKKKEQPELFF